MAKPRIAASLSLAALVSACASGNYVNGNTASGSARPSIATGSRPAGGAFVAPQVMQGTGIESVIGEQANALTRRFGQARIDLVEGDARKLQFSSEECVLDIYLYPLSSGAEPVATHVEARMRQGGGEVDRAQCIDRVEGAANPR